MTTATKNSILLITSILLCSCSGADRYATFSGYAQGGTYTVKANLKGATVPDRTIGRAIDSLLTDIDNSLSGYNRKSILSRRNAGEDVEPDRYFREIWELSGHFREISGGAFNPFAGPLFDIWGFGFSRDSMPDPGGVAEALEKCREEKVVNFNAIAQGYTCDVIAGYLHSIGVTDMLVDIGEIYCEGLNPSGNGWSIGIDTPEDGNDTPGKSISGIWTSDGGSHGIVTSGNYRKFYIRDGKKYAHTIDPRNGYPVSHNLLSATVVAATAAEADALATWFMVIGFDEAKAYVETRDGLEACLITSEGIWKSPGF